MTIKEELCRKSAHELAQLLRAGEVTAVEVTQAFLHQIEKLNPVLNAYLYVDAAGALQAAAAVDEDRAAGKELPPFAGVPVAIKDNICQRGIPTTCGSRMLEGWKPPYDATVVQQIHKARLPILGHTNMDEFAMGSSTEHSAFGPTRNPWDPSRIPGGSGGGSAAAVSAYLAPWALGTDTGGSIRQPSSVTGTVGTKPTYGKISRYGVVAMASSLDQVGPVARSVADAAALQEILSAHDPFDSTSLPEKDLDLHTGVEAGLAAKDLQGKRFGVVKELITDGYESGVIAVFQEIRAALEARGAQVVEVSCPSFEHALAAYYLIMPAEVSSNLARFDGVRYGNRALPESGAITAESMMSATRGANFGAEVKRRIILGTHVLSAGFFDAYYGAAQKVRTLVQRDLAKAFEKCDVLISPTSPVVAFPFGAKADPMAMYINDIATIPANLAGAPAISVPAGLSDGLPVGIQIIAQAHEDPKLYAYAAMVEAVADPAGAQCPVEKLEAAE
ncbi:Asp-tRNA(Asn)/Glu-tRNA(Gln) amidotransferase subunit GatA [Arcanobacterium hippocoleae]|uniref:Glutamyl-tRNA(Gln) amidotransferase subunit A n=1 Tax=Arcanobacterium hippocoleae TaxID=149017 RepID=A0ABU1T1E4_9ACTO|nr:Asp-tRNA(Asn)/Glu-tRNA(Gln) amidotransferase subunit GatA [Arcanobacterium hippocoleae]MDR6939204.1 aspartyl-tRNA(Asn)/glutamyl-tRNA(Gln) amidotransferase subunit A [Arcanobacterium hippocoleae]